MNDGPGKSSEVREAGARPSMEHRLRRLEARLANPLGVVTHTPPSNRTGVSFKERVLNRIYNREQETILREMTMGSDMRFTLALACVVAVCTIAISLMVPKLKPPREAAHVPFAFAQRLGSGAQPEIGAMAGFSETEDKTTAQTANQDADWIVRTELAADAAAGLRAVLAPVQFAWTEPASQPAPAHLKR
jgi:hypothetical protein